MSNAAATDVDPTNWRACAGTTVKIPSVNSRVYYFPQGQSEQCSTVPVLSPLVQSQPFVHCRVLSIRFLANPLTDEVFASLKLLPLSRPPHVIVRSPERNHDCYVENDGAVSFAKILTPSDANNGGGFSVPRYCAESIFPPLDFTADPPVQNVFVRDLHGVLWEFRHIYRGTPRRHLLTTGWSKFVNHKKLIAGDSVIFVRNRRSDELYCGVRRAAAVKASERWNWPVGSKRINMEEEEEREGFSRNGRGRVSGELVEMAAEMAARGMEFEVVYYPRAGWADFVVKAEAVEEALNVPWSPGMRVKMVIETEDMSRMTWFQGTISSAIVPENGQWRGSPWRMLQVTWDEPEVLQNVNRVSPWQVDYIVATSPLYSTTLPPAKKFRVPQNPGLLAGGDGELFFPLTGLSKSMMGHLNPSFINCTFPAGMQGARQEQICASHLSNLINENTHQIYADNLVYNTMPPKLRTFSTELNIGSSQSDNLSPDSQSSVKFFSNEAVGKRGCNSSTKVGINSFQLFGKVIHINETVESGFDNVASPEDEGSQVYRETEVVNNPSNLSDSRLYKTV